MGLMIDDGEIKDRDLIFGDEDELNSKSDIRGNELWVEIVKQTTHDIIFLIERLNRAYEKNIKNPDNLYDYNCYIYELEKIINAVHNPWFYQIMENANVENEYSRYIKFLNENLNRIHKNIYNCGVFIKLECSCKCKYECKCNDGSKTIMKCRCTCKGKEIKNFFHGR